MGATSSGFSVSLIFGIAVIVLLVLIISFSRRFKSCPPDKIMVITGSVGVEADGKPRKFICQHGGKRFVFPFIQDVQFLDLCPFMVSADFESLSKDSILIKIQMAARFSITTDEADMPKAAERFLGLPHSTIETLGREIIYGQIRLAIAQNTVEELYAKRDELDGIISDNIQEEFRKVGLKLTDAILLEICDKEGHMDALEKEEVARVLREAKSEIEKRVKSEIDKIQAGAASDSETE